MKRSIFLMICYSLKLLNFLKTKWVKTAVFASYTVARENYAILVTVIFSIELSFTELELSFTPPEMVFRHSKG